MERTGVHRVPEPAPLARHAPRANSSCIRGHLARGGSTRTSGRSHVPRDLAAISSWVGGPIGGSHGVVAFVLFGSSSS